MAGWYYIMVYIVSNMSFFKDIFFLDDCISNENKLDNIYDNWSSMY